MFSFGFMVNSISPSFSNSSNNKNEIKVNEPILTTKGIELRDGILFVDSGKAYLYTGEKAYLFNEPNNWDSFELPK